MKKLFWTQAIAFGVMVTSHSMHAFVIDTVARTVGETTRAVGTAVEETGEAVGGAVERTGEAIEGSTDKAKETVDKAKESVKPKDR